MWATVCLLAALAATLSACGQSTSRAEKWCATRARIDRTTADETVAALGPPAQEWPLRQKDIYGHPYTYDVLAYGNVRLAFTSTRPQRLRIRVCDWNRVRAWLRTQ